MTKATKKHHFLLITSIPGQLFYPTLPEYVVARHLISRGYKVTFALPAKGPLSDELEKLGANIEFVPMLSKSRSMKSRIMSTIKKGYLAKRWKGLDLVLSMRLSCTFHAVPLGQAMSIPVVSYIHGHTTDTEKFKRYRVTNASAVIAVSKACFESYPKYQEDTTKQHTEVIYNGIDIKDIISRSHKIDIRKSLGIPSDTAVIGMAGAYYAKGLDTLVQAARLLSKEFPDIHYIVAGAFRCKDFEQEIYDCLCEYHLTDHFHFTGQVGEIAPVMSACDVWTLPTRVDAFPMAGLEAMALGKPIVASAVGGIPEMLGSCANDYLVQPDSATPLASTISLLLESPERRCALGKNLQERASSNFDLSKQMNKLEQLLLDQLNCKSAA